MAAKMVCGRFLNHAAENARQHTCGSAEEWSQGKLLATHVGLGG